MYVFSVTNEKMKDKTGNRVSTIFLMICDDDDDDDKGLLKRLWYRSRLRSEVGAERSVRVWSSPQDSCVRQGSITYTTGRG